MLCAVHCAGIAERQQPLTELLTLNPQLLLRLLAEGFDLLSIENAFAKHPDHQPQASMCSTHLHYSMNCCTGCCGKHVDDVALAWPLDLKCTGSSLQDSGQQRAAGTT